MANIFSDNFNRADSGSLGGNWTENYGDFQINSNALKNANNTDQDNYAAVSSGFSPSSADYTVQSVVTISNVGGSNTAIGIWGRGDGASDFEYILRLNQNGGSGQLELYKFIDDATYAYLLGTYSTTVSTATAYTIKLEMNGTTIKGYLAGTERISVTDSSLTLAGAVGVGAYNNGTKAANHQVWDDFTADDIVVVSTSLKDIIGMGMIPFAR